MLHRVMWCYWVWILCQFFIALHPNGFQPNLSILYSFLYHINIILWDHLYGHQKRSRQNIR